MEKVLTFSATAVIFLIMAVVIALPTGYIVMLALGVLHDEWPQVPAFGYWACVVLVSAWRLVSPFSSKVESD